MRQREKKAKKINGAIALEKISENLREIREHMEWLRSELRYYPASLTFAHLDVTCRKFDKISIGKE